MKVDPTCRYGHGALHLINGPNPTTGKNIKFSFVADDDIDMRFVGEIYTCVHCGYTEFFDDDPEWTARTLGAVNVDPQN